MTIEELLAQIVKDVVSEALKPVIAKLDAITERVNEFPTEQGMRRAAAESIEHSLSEFRQMVRDLELNQGRAELRLARAQGRVA